MKLLIGGSPCTHWSIAQTKNRETEASGIGWELFLNYRIARDKYKPDYFLYENNKSMSPAIRTQITAELGVEPVLINSALVSAQNRQRLYWVGRRNPDGTYSQVPIEQPEDRGILLRDILETGIAWQEKSYCITATEYKGSNPKQTLSKHRRTMVAEPIIVNGTKSGKARTVDAHMGNLENNLVPRINNPNHTKQQYDCIAEPVRIGTIENDAKNQLFDSQQYRVYSPDGKAVSLCGNGGGLGAKTGLYATPVDTDADGILHLGSLYGQHSRWGVFAKDGKCPTITASMGMGGGHVPMVPTRTDEEGHCQKNPTTAKQIYEVRDGKISIGNTWYPIKLRDGFYIIRKLTVRECMRLQTVPEEYVFPVSDSQAYKMLGNGWTVDVIAHIMSHFTGLTEEPVEVLSMYDGMSCGHIALDKLGVQPWLLRYYATEIDKYAIQTTQHNFPETIQLGDAFQVRNDDWRVKE
jgi:DNA (cytosine-5)-methyltransferase 3A